mgnify:CR=1 FL=1
MGGSGGNEFPPAQGPATNQQAQDFQFAHRQIMLILHLLGQHRKGPPMRRLRDHVEFDPALFIKQRLVGRIGQDDKCVPPDRAIERQHQHFHEADFRHRFMMMALVARQFSIGERSGGKLRLARCHRQALGLSDQASLAQELVRP